MKPRGPACMMYNLPTFEMGVCGPDLLYFVSLDLPPFPPLTDTGV